MFNHGIKIQHFHVVSLCYVFITRIQVETTHEKYIYRHIVIVCIIVTVSKTSKSKIG